MVDRLSPPIDWSALRVKAMSMLDADDVLKEVYLPEVRELLIPTRDESKVHICSYCTRPRFFKEGNCSGCGAPA